MSRLRVASTSRLTGLKSLMHNFFSNRYHSKSDDGGIGASCCPGMLTGIVDYQQLGMDRHGG